MSKTINIKKVRHLPKTTTITNITKPKSDFINETCYNKTCHYHINSDDSCNPCWSCLEKLKSMPSKCDNPNCDCNLCRESLNWKKL